MLILPPQSTTDRTRVRPGNLHAQAVHSPTEQRDQYALLNHSAPSKAKGVPALHLSEWKAVSRGTGPKVHCPVK